MSRVMAAVHSLSAVFFTNSGDGTTTRWMRSAPAGPTPTAAASVRRGERLKSWSSSSGATFLPEASTMTSLARPVMRRLPRGSIRPTSPVRYQPSSVLAAAVSSGFR